MSALTIYRGRANTGIGHADENRFGPLGPVTDFTIHHSAGPRARTKAQAQELHRRYQAQHIAQGWGSIAYHFSMDDKGRFYVLRDKRFKGAHVGRGNTGNLGLVVHGNYEHDELTAAQKESLLWLFRGGLFALTGVHEHEFKRLRGHTEWPSPGGDTECPGIHLLGKIAQLRKTEFH